MTEQVYVGEFVAPGADHCWHSSQIQHAMVNHHDVTCCFCGTVSCIDGTRIKGHGSHANPGSYFDFPVEKCKERGQA